MGANRSPFFTPLNKSFHPTALYELDHIFAGGMRAENTSGFMLIPDWVWVLGDGIE